MAPQYSVPSEAKRLLLDGILGNPLIQKNLPAGASEAARQITFEGSDSPSLPINWRFAESISVLKAYEATVLNLLLQKKYGLDPVPIKINTDHAQLFIFSLLLWVLDTEGTPLSPLRPDNREQVAKYFPNWDKHDAAGTPYRTAVTNIYKTKDDRYFHLHGSLNPSPSLAFLDLPLDLPVSTLEEAISPLQAAVSAHTAAEMQSLADAHGQAGTICLTPDEYKASPHGQANAHIGLFELSHHPYPSPQKPAWWPSTPRTSPLRPLGGLKVVSLTRIIAGPTICRGLAELGASVMRVTAPHLADFSVLHPDLNHGKWNASLDLRREADRETLRALVREADVFVQGYRPGVLDKYGFGERDVLEMAREREDGRGVVYVAENCYGWQGEWMGRSGWQQISDACCGVSYEFGRAMGFDEPVTPVFPNSDYCTGVIGVIGVLTALLRRGEEGGSYTVKVALNYYNQWLVNTCGVYPPEVWDALKRAKDGTALSLRHYHHMFYALPILLKMVQETSASKLFKPEFFTQYRVKNLGGVSMRIVAPVLQFPNGEVKPGFDVGTRTNGVDQARWPEDLDVEVVV
ncbi:CoA-transferase family III domain-containing protein [Podospora appendiculata]|uniref:CoA-transferase family III domain-containing protein n=1 Tax=Podospora appendiculata TaxID=314037 RepID=A0AAE1CCQ3_9PEZI|nr:CoA-transferase family III domain-containing protein [Podospora appendiculata]